jgi:RNA polymerase sigma-32 factor
MNAIAQNLLTPGVNFKSYEVKIKAFTLLNREEEKALLEDFKKNKNPDSLNKIILSSLQFVIPIAQKYKGYGLPVEDIVQEGNIGLLRAIKRFDTEQDVRLLTFASYWIKAEIHEYIIRNWKLVKVATTKAQRKLFFKLRSTKKSLTWIDNNESQAIANKLNVKESDVIEMEKRLYGKDVYIDIPQDEETPRESLSALMPVKPSIEDEIIEQDSIQKQKSLIRSALKEMDSRSADIIVARHMLEETAPLRELATKHGVSMERIRQIEAVALKKIKTFVVNA